MKRGSEEGVRGEDLETLLKSQLLSPPLHSQPVEAMLASVQEGERLFTTLSRLAPVGMFQTDADGNCLFVNERWCEFAGMEPKDAMGMGWGNALHPEDRERVFREWYDAALAGEEFRSEYRFRTPEGKVTWLFGSGLALHDDAGEVTGYIGAVTDISAQKEAERTLQDINGRLEQLVSQRTEELEAANRELEGFTYSVSHDLRAPLRAIISTSRMLVEEFEEQLGPDGLALLHRQEAAAGRLAVLIDELLKFSRLGREELVRDQVDLSALTTETAQMLTADQGTSLDLCVQPAMQAAADPKLIRFVLENLLSNSIKFAKPGEHLRIEVGFSDGAFYVRDNGTGFDSQFAHKLFLPFERLVRNDQYPGTGIGLANVKRIIERHGGTVRAESSGEGKGATFYFTLPTSK